MQASDSELSALFEVLHDALTSRHTSADEATDEAADEPVLITANVLCEFVQLTQDDLHELVMQANARIAYASLAAWLLATQPSQTRTHAPTQTRTHTCTRAHTNATTRQRERRGKSPTWPMNHADPPPRPPARYACATLSWQRDSVTVCTTRQQATLCSLIRRLSRAELS